MDMEYFSTLWPIKTIEIMATILLCGMTRATIYIRLPFRYIVGIPLSIITLYALLLSSIPPYRTSPNIQDFFQTQKNKIIIISPTASSQEYVHIQTNRLDKKITIITWQQEQELIEEKTSLQYVSTNTGNQIQVFFLSKNGNIVQIFPQSNIEIQGIYPNPTEIKINKGKIATHILKWQEKTISFVLYSWKKEELWSSELTKRQEQEKWVFFKKQRGNSFFYAPYSIQIQQFLLDTAQKIFPQIYTQKRANFIAYREIINIPFQTKTTVQSDTTQATQEILKQGNRGREETKIYKWIHNFF